MTQTNSKIVSRMQSFNWVARSPLPHTRFSRWASGLNPISSQPPSSIGLPPSSPQIMTRAKHYMFKPKKLFNLNSTSSSIFSPLPKNSLNTLPDSN